MVTEDMETGHEAVVGADFKTNVSSFHGHKTCTSVYKGYRKASMRGNAFRFAITSSD